VNALLTLGFKLETMADLIRDELATVRVEVVTDRGSKIEIAYVRITDAAGQVMMTPDRWRSWGQGNAKPLRRRTHNG
jgi:hypothetical protein